MITIEEARFLYVGAESAHDFDHVLRVLALAERIARIENADLEVVRTAALLHDIARNVDGPPGTDHALLGAQRASMLLAERGAPAPFIEAVADAIASHRYRSGSRPTSREARILFDADKLDAIGAIGIARAYAMGGRMGQHLWSETPADHASSETVGNDTSVDHTPVREFELKLTRLRAILYTAEARRIARGRHRFMVAFFKRLDREVRGEV